MAGEEAFRERIALEFRPACQWLCQHHQKLETKAESA